MKKVAVTEIRQNGRPAGWVETYDSGPMLKMYVIRVDGRRYDSRLSKRQAMKAAKAVAEGAPVLFEPCELQLYSPRPLDARP